MVSQGIKFVRDPKTADYGTVAVFKDLYGNLWDLIEYAPGHPMNPQAPADQPALSTFGQKRTSNIGEPRDFYACFTPEADIPR